MKKYLFLAVLAVVVFCSFGKVPVLHFHSSFASKLIDTGGLPDSYKNRHFINDAQVLANDPATIPGNIVRWNASTSAYEIITLKALIKGGKPAVAQAIANPLVYKGQVTETSTLNGSDLIADIKADKGQIIDLQISDNATYTVPDGQIDTTAALGAMRSASADDLKSMYYVTSATLSVISYKIHAEEKKPGKLKSKIEKLAKPDTSKKGLYNNIKKSKSPAPFSMSNGDTRTLTEKTLSIQIVPVATIITVSEGKK